MKKVANRWRWLFLAAVPLVAALGGETGCGECDWESECQDKEGRTEENAGLLCNAPYQVWLGGDVFPGKEIHWYHDTPEATETCVCDFTNDTAKGCKLELLGQ